MEPRGDPVGEPVHGAAAPVPPRWAAGAVRSLARHPGLWTTAAAQALRLARRGWWRRPPFLPLPDRDYLRFRLETQYGPSGEPDPEDLVAYLRWCRRFPRGA